MERCGLTEDWYYLSVHEELGLRVIEQSEHRQKVKSSLYPGGEREKH